MKTYEIPSDIGNEIKSLKEKIGLFRQGEINPVQFKGIRVGQGVYEQRKNDTYMFRIRVAGGVISPRQLRRVAELSRDYGSDHFHVTTRQDVQLHYVKLEDTPYVYEELIKVGLSPRGGGGNTIRNIMASVDSGYAPQETFDVLPYAVSLTSRMIAEQDSWNLPRKFKIAFSNSDEDNSDATITCLGFIAKIRDGQKGFAVYVGGGMGAKPMAGKLVWDFIPDDQVYGLTKAIKIMFDKNGNRRKRFVAKIKFLVDKLGVDEFRRKVQEEWDLVQASHPEPLDLQAYTYEYKAPTRTGIQPIEVDSQEFKLWHQRYVSPQKQEGLFSIKIPLHLGDIDNGDGLALTQLLEPFGENCIRLAFNQNLHVINIPGEYLGYLYQGLAQLHTLSTNPVIVSNMIACTGAATCRLGLCLPRGLLPETAERLLGSDLDLDRIPDFKIHVSGCPNTCGRHHSADLGLFGRVGRKEKVNYPAYNVLAGAVIRDGQSEFAQKCAEVAAKDAPALIEDILRYWLGVQKQYANFRTWIQNGGAQIIKELADQYNAAIPTLDQNPEYYRDWGAENQFSILHGQQAECSAGVFDMIDVDAEEIVRLRKAIPEIADEAERKEVLYHSVVVCARMLLVTRDIEVKSDDHALTMFGTHFIQAHLIEEHYQKVVDLAQERDLDALWLAQDLVLDLGRRMMELYQSMDDSLRFPSLKDQTSTH